MVLIMESHPTYRQELCGTIDIEDTVCLYTLPTAFI